MDVIPTMFCKSFESSKSPDYYLNLMEVSAGNRNTKKMPDEISKNTVKSKVLFGGR